MIELITGSRSITSYLLAKKAQEIFIKECENKGYGFPTLIKHGDARGADSFLKAWAIANGVKCEEFRAKWNDWKGLPEDRISLKDGNFGRTYNALAGHNRNIEMANSGFDILFALRSLGKSSGTDQMIEYVRSLKKPIFLYRENNKYEWINAG